jgi:Mce-associated membrane protein
VSHPSTRSRGPGSSPARRTLTAAARAAAKRAERADQEPREAREPREAPESRKPRREEPRPRSGRTVVIEPPDGWDDPPEPAPDRADGTDGTSDDSDGTDGAELVLPVRRRRIGTLSLTVLLLAALVAAGVLGRQYQEGRVTEQAREEALAAARKAAPVVLSYDHRRLERDFARARALLTGEFREEYARTTKAVVGPTARKYRGVVKATVVTPPEGGPAASVVSASPDRVVVLLFVNQVTESTQVTGSRVDLNRVRITMADTDDGWKVSAVDAL